MTVEIIHPSTKFSFAERFAGVAMPENLYDMNYQQLYDLHTRLTLTRRSIWDFNQIGFGLLTADDKPNNHGISHIHMAPYMDTKQSTDDPIYSFKKPVDRLKMQVMMTEDVANLIRYYDAFNRHERPHMLEARTYPDLAENFKKLGFAIQIDKKDTEHGMFPVFESSFDELVSKQDNFIQMQKELCDQAAREYRLTPEAIRIDAINRSKI
ncbi:hypothetical protein BH09PAT2_BH09PAT2_04910 [soil metagenome]